jgi:hypothetical protein
MKNNGCTEPRHIFDKLSHHPLRWLPSIQVRGVPINTSEVTLETLFSALHLIMAGIMLGIMVITHLIMAGIMSGFMVITHLMTAGIMSGFMVITSSAESNVWYTNSSKTER